MGCAAMTRRPLRSAVLTAALTLAAAAPAAADTASIAFKDTAGRHDPVAG